MLNGGALNVEDSKKVRYIYSTEKRILDLVDKNLKSANCRYRNEYIDKAILNYSGQIAEQENNQYLYTKAASLLRSIIEESDHRTEKIVFKLAVEIAMMMHLIARSQNVSQEDMDWLRAKSIEDIKGTNGTLKFDDIYWWFRE